MSSTISEQFKLTRQIWGHVQPIKHHAQTVLYADNQKKSHVITTDGYSEAAIGSVNLRHASVGFFFCVTVRTTEPDTATIRMSGIITSPCIQTNQSEESSLWSSWLCLFECRTSTSKSLMSVSLVHPSQRDLTTTMWIPRRLFSRL